MLKGNVPVNRDEILAYIDCKIVECYLLKDSNKASDATIQGRVYQSMRSAIFGKELRQDGIDRAIVDAERATTRLENDARQDAEVDRIRARMPQDDNGDTTPEKNIMR